MDKSIDILNRTILCHAETIYRKNGVWEGPNPLNSILPAFILQLTISILASRFFLLILKPFNQPPFVAEILGGIMLGPSGLGRIRNFMNMFFPTYSFPVLEPMAHFALVYYAFLMGLEMDLRSIVRTGSKARIICISGLIFPFTLGAGLFVTFSGQTTKGFFFWGSCVTITGFSVLSCVLEKQKMLHTEAGKTALSTAPMNELCSWVLLALGMAISSNGSTVHWAVLCTSAFVLFLVYAVRPSLLWLIRRTPEDHGLECYVSFILMGVSLCGVATDASGTHPMIGAFVFGLIMPNEMLDATLVDRLDDFVLGILMPAFYTVCGLRTNVDVLISDGTTWVMVLVVIVVLSGAKLFSTVVASLFSQLPIKEAITTGLLLNTKGIMAMIFIEVGQEQGALTTQTYTIMVIAVLVMTMMVTPISMFNNPERNFVPYKRRTIQKARPEEELRVLACVHGMRNVHSVINLLEASNSNHLSPISVFAVHLVELTGRAAATLVVHNANKAAPRNTNQAEAQTEQIISSFDNYELRCDGVGVQTITARSAYTTMDEDICGIAEDKRAAIIILPFHKLQTVEGEMEDMNPAIRSVNENVMANAPCSVGILIERGLTESGNFPKRVVMIYMGGPDDREALAYAWRMAEHEDIDVLNVVRFIPAKEAYKANPVEVMTKTDAAVTVNIDDEKEKALDEEYLNNFKIATVNDKSVSYSEVVLHDEEETVRNIKSMDGQYDLYLVGKGRGIVSPLTAGLADWCDCPELGAIGDLLVTSEFSSAFAVLVVQQYVKFSDGKDGSVRSRKSLTNTNASEIDQVEWRTSASGVDDFRSVKSDGDHSNHLN